MDRYSVSQNITSNFLTPSVCTTLGGSAKSIICMTNNLEDDIHSKEHVNFRIDRKHIEKIQKEANVENISLNTMVNRIIADHVNWHSNIKKVGVVTVWKEMLTKLTEKHSEDELVLMAKLISEVSAKEISIVFHNRFTAEKFLNIIQDWARHSNFPYKYDVDNDEHHLSIHHDMGKKWSLLLSTVWQSGLEAAKVKKVESDVQQNSFSIKVVL